MDLQEHTNIKDLELKLAVKNKKNIYDTNIYGEILESNSVISVVKLYIYGKV